MESTRKQAQLTTLLPNEVLSAVERLRINATRQFTNQSRGENLAGRGGSSTDFADYRDYVEGDDIRNVDWNIYARLQRPYIKLYRREEEMHVVVLVDASKSMDSEDKLLRAKQLACGFGMMGLLGVERVSVYAFNAADASRLPHLPPCTGRASLHKLMRFVESIEPGGDAPLDTGIETMLRRHRGRGVVILLSDCLTFGDVPKAFNKLYSSGLEILTVQILGPTELDPDITGDIRLVDCESQASIDVSGVGNLIHIYHEYRLAWQRKLEQLSTQRAGKYLLADSKAPIDRFVLDTLRRKGWVI